jgi:two-component system sensor histidine kinase UhpB
MDNAPSELWIFVVGSGTTIALMAMTCLIFVWHQKKLVAQARSWGLFLLDAQERERQAIARDLHDDLIQRLWVAQMELEKGKVAPALTTVTSVIVSLRGIAHGLHPSSLVRDDLASALDELVTNVRNAGSSEVELSVKADGVVNHEAAIALYRVAQEGLTNAHKYAHAQKIRVELTATSAVAILHIVDDGVGYDATESVAASLGVRSMRERMLLLGGSLTINSSPGQGTSIVASIPQT